MTDKKSIDPLQYITHAETYLSAMLNKAGLNKDFYFGRQWFAEEEEQLKSKGISTITINHILPIINAISGLQRQNKSDIKVMPKKNATSAVAGVLTELVKHTIDVSDGSNILNSCFNNGIITNRDFIKITIDKVENQGGQVKLSRHSCFEVLPDPDCKSYDLQEAKFIIHRQWIDKNEINLLYDNIETDLDETSEDIADYLLNGSSSSGEVKAYDNPSVDKFRSLIYEVWWKEKIKAVKWFDNETGSVKILTKPNDIARAKTSVKFMPERFSIVDTIHIILHKTIYHGKRKLKDETSPFGDEILFYPFVQFAPFFSDGDIMGIIDNLIDPQREENYNRTQAARLLNQTANSGWLVGKINQAYKAVLEMFGSVPGIVIEESKCGGKVEKLQPNQLSQGHILLSERSVVDIKEISNANDALQGYSGKNESGKAIDLKRKQGAMSLQPVIDNFNWTLELIGGLLVKIIRKTEVYTNEEIRAIIDENRLIDAKAMEEAEQKFRLRPMPPMVIPPPDQERLAMLAPLDQIKVKRAYEEAKRRIMPDVQAFPKIMKNYEALIRREAQEILLSKLKKDVYGEYGIKITLSPEAPTVQWANMIELSEIAKNYPGAIPLEVYIKNSSLTNKEEIAEEIRKQQNKAANMAMQQAGVK